MVKHESWVYVNEFRPFASVDLGYYHETEYRAMRSVTAHTQEFRLHSK
jgi:hypothetical protein